MSLSDAEFEKLMRQCNEAITRIQNPKTRPYSVAVEYFPGCYTVKKIFGRANRQKAIARFRAGMVRR